MAASFNDICRRLDCTVECKHQSLSAESPDGSRIVFFVPAENVDLATLTCILLAPLEQRAQESRAASADVMACEERAERCVTDAAIEALGIVPRARPVGTDTPDTGSALTHLVLRLRVHRQKPGHYSAQILTVLFIGEANRDDAP